MKIGLINTYSTHNIGDSAIYQSLAALVQNAQVVTDLTEEAPLAVPGIASHGDTENCDAYISVGGDIFNNAREWLVTRQFIQNLGKLYRAPRYRTFVFGQSIPRSCHGFAFRLLAHVMKRISNVYVRDRESYDRLLAAGVNVKLTYDVAFSLLPTEKGQAAARQLLSGMGVEAERCALMSLRSFDSMYRHDNQAFVDKMTKLCIRLAERGYQPVILLQAKAYGADQDFQVAQTIMSRVPAVKLLDPFQAPAAVTPWEVAIGALGLAKLAIAVRYHTAIFRLLSGRVPYSIFYSNKGEDLVKRLGLPGCNLSQFDADKHIDEIERTAGQAFDIQAIRQQVQQDFHRCYSASLEGKGLGAPSWL